MGKGLLQKVLSFGLAQIGIGILSLWFILDGLLEPILFHCFAYLLHNCHKSLAQRSIILDERYTGGIFLRDMVSYLISNLFILDEF